jgi:hypothetical protein
MDREMKILYQLQITTNPWEELIWKINLFNRIFWRERKWLCGTSKCLENYSVLPFRVLWMCCANSGQSKIDNLYGVHPIPHKFSLTQQSGTSCMYWTWEWNWKENTRLWFHWQEYAATSWQTFPWKIPTNREKGQASKEVCNVRNKTVFWCPNF